MKKNILDKIDKSIKVIETSKSLYPQIIKIVNTITKCYRSKHKVILFGNGGSATDAQHIASELVGRLNLQRKSLPAISLTSDTSILTSIGNDFKFDYIFSRQCESLVEKNDVVIATSTSGNSKNVIQGVKTAKKNGAIIIGLLGKKGGKIKSLVDIPLVVPSNSTTKIQDSHRVLIHVICELIEEKLFTQNSTRLKTK